MNLLVQSLDALESSLALSLLQALWQGTLLALAAKVTLSAMAKRSAAARHTVGLLFLLAMLACPLVQFARLTTTEVPVKVIIDGSATSVLPDPVAAMEPSPLTELSATVLALASPAWLTLAWVAGVLFMMVRLAGGA